MTDVEMRPLITKEGRNLNFDYAYCKKHGCGAFEICFDIRCPHCQGGLEMGGPGGKGYNKLLDE